MKSLLKLSVLAFLPVFVNAQQINYDKLFDDPEHFFHLKAGLFGDIDWFERKNYRAGLFFGADVNLGTRLTVSSNLLFGLHRWNKPSKIALNDLKRTHKDLSGRATLHLSYKSYQKNTKVILKQTSSSRASGSYVYTTTHTKSIDIPAGYIGTFGLTGSAGFYQNQIFQSDRNLFAFQDSTVSADDMAINYGGAYISAGFSFREYQNFLINATNTETGEKYYEKGSQYHSNIIIEAVYMPGVFVSKSFTVPEVGTYTLAQKPEVKNLGVRLISDYHYLGKVNFGGRIEIGTRPGIFVPMSKKNLNRGNWYAALTCYVVVNK